MDVPNSCAIGSAPRRYCLPAVIRSNSMECRPRPLGMLRRSISTSYGTPVSQVTPYGGRFTPNWGYYYHNPHPSFNKDKTYYGDPRNVYWPGRYRHISAVNTWEKKATNSANYTDFVVKKHWQYPFSYWARYYWNKPPGGGGR